jgi:hypothetical protein
MATNPETLKYRKENNLCPRDGRPNKTGRKMCEYCLKKSAEKTERHRQKKMANNLCLSCGQKVNDVKFCDKCKKNIAFSSHKSHLKRYNKRKKNGECTLCGNDTIPGKTACRSCLDTRASLKKARHDKYRHDGKCSQCGGDLGDKNGKRCKICIDKRNEWYQGSPTQAKDKIRRDKNREITLRHYGGKCVCCGEDELYFLAIDHIDGDGNTHRKKIKKWGSGFFGWLVKNNFPEGFQILCHNCNMGKHLNGGVCPHKNTDEVLHISPPLKPAFHTKVHYKDIGKMESVPYPFDNYESVPPNKTSTVKTRYVHRGKGKPSKFDLDEE